MSRISYSEDEDYQGQFTLWRANVNRSLAGKAGRKALEDLRRALLNLPEKRLVYHRLVKGADVCAVGAIVAQRIADAEGKSHDEAVNALASKYSSCVTCGCAQGEHVDGGRCQVCDKRIADGKTWATECSAYVGDSDDDYIDEDDGWETDYIGVDYGIPRMVGWRLVELNDFELDRDTPEERYQHVLAWVDKTLAMSADQIMRRDMP